MFRNYNLEPHKPMKLRKAREILKDGNKSCDSEMRHIAPCTCARYVTCGGDAATKVGHPRAQVVQKLASLFEKIFFLFL
jgi:hypothetical protein